MPRLWRSAKRCISRLTANGDSNRPGQARTRGAAGGPSPHLRDADGRRRTARTELTSGGLLVRTQPCPPRAGAVIVAF
jgi:hypothetical protein